MAAQTHLLFVTRPSGYELREREGEAPAVGSTVEEQDGAVVVSKVGPSPLPGDARPCAYTQDA